MNSSLPLLLLQIPDLPVIGFPPVPFHPRDKLPAVVRFAGRRPLVWIDDALTPEAHAWAASRRMPTLLISIGPAEGLTRPSSINPCSGPVTISKNDQLPSKTPITAGLARKAEGRRLARPDRP